VTAPLWIDGTFGLPGNLWLLLSGVWGACLGSFLNVVIHRLPRKESLIRPGSHCPQCGAAVRSRDNVPVLGWLLLKGRCRDCSVSIPPRYPLVELLGAVCVLTALLASGDWLSAVLRSLLLLTMVAVFFIDLDHQLILDVMTLPGTVIGLAVAPWIGTSRLDALIGAVAGGLLLEGLRRAWLRFRGVEGLGGGDVKLAMCLGAWLGWQGVAMTFLFGSLAGTIVGLILVRRGKVDGTTLLPYGVFLAPAAMLVTVAGPAIWAWYFGGVT
jgi:leader peptidase (prepilin peptidase) / N-methyltransferase